MTPPRIGFRWSFAPDSAHADQASAVRFRIHLQGPSPAIEITRETSSSNLNVNLADSFPLGECEWWVEALMPIGPSLLSQRERFLLEQ